MTGDNGKAPLTLFELLEFFARVGQCCAAAGTEVQIDIYTDIRSRTIEIALGDLTAIESESVLTQELSQSLVRIADHKAYAQMIFSSENEKVLKLSGNDYLELLKRSGAECAIVRKAVHHLHGQYIEIGFSSPSMHPHAD